jgi:hypothetical protein
MAANKRGGTIAQIVGLIDGNTRESSGSISAHSKNGSFRLLLFISPVHFSVFTRFSLTHSVFVTRVPGSEVRASASAAFPALWIGADNMTLGSTHAALTWGAGGRDIAVAPLGEFNSLHKDSPGTVLILSSINTFIASCLVCFFQLFTHTVKRLPKCNGALSNRTC